MAIVVLLAGFPLMLYNLFFVVRLRKKAPGGIIGNRLMQLMLFIVAFAVSYLVVGILILDQKSTLAMLILSFILVFGAVFVLLVLHLVQAILKAIE